MNTICFRCVYYLKKRKHFVCDVRYTVYAHITNLSSSLSYTHSPLFTVCIQKCNLTFWILLSLYQLYQSMIESFSKQSLVFRIAQLKCRYGRSVVDLKHNLLPRRTIPTLRTRSRVLSEKLKSEKLRFSLSLKTHWIQSTLISKVLTLF